MRQELYLKASKTTSGMDDKCSQINLKCVQSLVAVVQIYFQAWTVTKKGHLTRLKVIILVRAYTYIGVSMVLQHMVLSFSKVRFVISFVFLQPLQYLHSLNNHKALPEKIASIHKPSLFWIEIIHTLFHDWMLQFKSGNLSQAPSTVVHQTNVF